MTTAGPAGELPRRTKARAIPILLYHSVDEGSAAAYRRWMVTPAQFDEHMRLLSSEGYRPATISTLIGMRNAGGSIPERTVALPGESAHPGGVRTS